MICTTYEMVHTLFIVIILISFYIKIWNSILVKKTKNYNYNYYTKKHLDHFVSTLYYETVKNIFSNIIENLQNEL